MIHVLMFSLDTALVTQPEGDSRRRHLHYAELAGRLTVIVHTPPGAGELLQPSETLTIIPTNSRHKLIFPFDALRLARQTLQEYRVDLIATQEPFLTGLVGVWLRGRWRIPLLVQNHSSFFSSGAWMAEKPLRNRLLAAVGGFVVRRADMYRTVNTRERDQFIAAGGMPERVVALPLGTASARFAEPPDPAERDALRAHLGLQPQHRVIIWVGYPTKAKRLPLLLSVFTRVAAADADARLLLVGDLGDAAGDLHARIRDLRLVDRVILPGAVVHNQLPLYYALGTVYAHTSAYEGMPRVLVEASAAGLPLVAIRAPGVEEVIEEGVNGYLVPEGALEQMAAQLVSLLHDPALARKLGANARKIAFERYDADAYAENWVGVWRKAVELGMRAR
jgi:glycosyltransferase involved in cell wall biosynthesis